MPSKGHGRQSCGGHSGRTSLPALPSVDHVVGDIYPVDVDKEDDWDMGDLLPIGEPEVRSSLRADFNEVWEACFEGRSDFPH